MEEMEKKYCRGLHEIAAAINSVRTLDGVFDTLVTSVTNVLHAKGCTLMLLAPDRQTLTHVASHGLSESYVQKGPVSADKSISDALAGKPVSVMDASQDPRVQYAEQARQEGIVSILSVPMMLRGEPLGVVRVYTAERRQFSEDDVFFVSAVANLGAIALENAKSLESCQRDNQTLSQELLEWKAAMGVWPPRLSYRR